jgi:hypothetical protein
MAMAERLEQQMRYNEARGKLYAWETAQPQYLLSRLEDEFWELSNEMVEDPDTPTDEKRIQHESMDVIALAHFIWCQSLMREAAKP